MAPRWQAFYRFPATCKQHGLADSHLHLDPAALYSTNSSAALATAPSASNATTLLGGTPKSFGDTQSSSLLIPISSASISGVAPNALHVTLHAAFEIAQHHQHEPCMSVHCHQYRPAPQLLERTSTARETEQRRQLMFTAVQTHPIRALGR